MKTVTTLLLLICFPALAAKPDVGRVRGAWLREGVKWVNAPPDVSPRLQSGEAAILYFGNDHTFALIYCWLYREPKRYITISHGDPRDVYLGKWTAEGNDIAVEYRLVDRTVKIKGELLPGPVQHAKIKISRALFHLEKNSFRRATGLDKDAAEVVAGLTGGTGLMR